MRRVASLLSFLALAGPQRAYALAAQPPGGRGSTVGGTSGVASRRALNRDWYARRAAGDPSARKRKPGSRAKKSERAADLLYQTVSIDPSITFPGLAGTKLDAAAEAMLAECHVADDVSPAAAAPAAGADSPSKEAGTVAPRAGGSSGVMWGSCSTGPVLCSRLISAGLLSPTPIQEAAYDSIAKGSNALLLAQTGAGKTLAFVLPLLSRLRRDQPYSALFVSPSLELASQLQANVDLLWPPAPRSVGGAPISALRIIQSPEAAGRAEDAEGSGDAGGWVGEQLLAQLDGSPLIVGTPHALRMLFDAAAEAVSAPRVEMQGRGVARGRGSRGGRGRGGGGRGRPAAGGWTGFDRIDRIGGEFGRGGALGGGSRFAGGGDRARLGALGALDSPPVDGRAARWESLDPQLIAAARALRRSLQAVVLDEADQLLGSDALAAAQAARRARGSEPLTGKERAIEKRATAPSACELLLRELPRPPSELQLIAASASASRTLRRQLLPLVAGVSIDKAVPLIQVSGGSDSAAVDGKGRGTSAPLAGRVPETIRHMYALWRPAPRKAGAVCGDAEGGVGGAAAEDTEATVARRSEALVHEIEAGAETEVTNGAAAIAQSAQVEDVGSTHEDVAAPALEYDSWSSSGMVGEGEDWHAEGSVAEETEGQPDERSIAALQALLAAIQPLPPAPAILFAERGQGVAKTAAALRALGMRRVVTLPLEAGGGGSSALDHPDGTAGPVLSDAAWDRLADQPEIEPVAPSPLMEPGASGDVAAHGLEKAAWEAMPIYVASERYGRGLDLGLGYVLLLSPPSTAAGYLHLAGRTGRQGASGTVVTLLSRQQAPRLASFARLLGVGLRRLPENESRC